MRYIALEKTEGYETPEDARRWLDDRLISEAMLSGESAPERHDVVVCLTLVQWEEYKINLAKTEDIRNELQRVRGELSAARDREIDFAAAAQLREREYSAWQAHTAKIKQRLKKLRRMV